MNEITEADRVRNTLKMCNHYWLVAAKEALQGDLGKLRAKVAMAEGLPRDTIFADMRAGGK